MELMAKHLTELMEGGTLRGLGSKEIIARTRPDQTGRSDTCSSGKAMQLI